MKTKYLINLYLSEVEIKEAVVEYLRKKNKNLLAGHLENNAVILDYVVEKECYVLSIDGEIESKFKIKLDKKRKKDKKRNDNYFNNKHNPFSY